MKELTILAVWGVVFFVVFRFAEAYYTRLDTHGINLWVILAVLVVVVALVQGVSAADTAAWRRRNQNDRNP